MGVYLKFWAINRSSLLLSGSEVPREMESGFLAGIGDLLALSFLLYLRKGSC